MNFQSTKSIVRIDFDSVTSLHDAHDNYTFVEPYNASRNAEFKKSRSGSENWYGIKGGYESVMRTFKAGHPKIESKLDDLAVQCSLKLSRAIGVGRKFKRGPEGDEVDIERIKSCDFDTAWTSMIRKTKRGRTAIRLCVDIGANAGTRAEDMQWRGIAASLLSSIIHKAGYSIEILACFAVSGSLRKSDKDIVVTCRVKPRMTQTNLSFLASTICLPGFFRTLGFSAVVIAADCEGQNVDHVLGSYANVARLLPVDNKVTTLFVSTDVRDEASAIAWVNKTLQLLQGSKS
jgi:hypothetical protein